jgi:hypothetical protein
MSEPKATMTGLCLRAVCERLPSGALGKLAFVSKEFRNACEEEEFFRAKKPRRIPLHTSVCLLTTEGEVQWAIDLGCPLKRLVNSLALAGALPALKKAVELGAPTDHVCFYAAGHLEVLRWARENGCPWNSNTCSSAANGGHFEILKWARENGCPWGSSTCAYAVKGGHFEILKWARQNGCPWDSNTCSYAAHGGHFEILKWARENGCPWNRWTCTYAAFQGHLEMLKWARQDGCPWDSDTCDNAASAGHLEVLKWARENRCPWGRCTCWEAAEGGHFEVLKWAIKNGAPWQHHRLDILDRVRGTDAEGWYRDILSKPDY